jgi:serine/threonine protein kinase
LFWLAPEYLVGDEEYHPGCDMYSMGIILNECYSRHRPYENEDLNVRQLLSDIVDRRVNKRPFMSPTCPPKMAELIKKLWSRDSANRPQAKQLDELLVEFNITDVEPFTQEALNAKPRTKDMLYDIFPK